MLKRDGDGFVFEDEKDREWFEKEIADRAAVGAAIDRVVDRLLLQLSASEDGVSKAWRKLVNAAGIDPRIQKLTYDRDGRFYLSDVADED